MSIIIVVFTALLLLLSAFVVLIILMQKPSANAGMGSALGGGAAEQAFGGNAANVLTKTTVFAIIGFFVLSFALYLGNLAMSGPATQRADEGDNLGALVSSIEEDAPEPEAVVTEPAEQPDAAVNEAEAASLDELLDGTQTPNE